MEKERRSRGHEMTCTRHPFESGVGVCATCLSERLAELIASPPPPSPSHRHRRASLPTLPLPPVAPSSAAGSRRSSVLSTIFGRHGHGYRDKKPQRSSSWLSALLRGGPRKKMSRLFSASDAVGCPPGSLRESERQRGGCDAEPTLRPKPSRMRRATTEHSRLQQGGLAELAKCFGPMVKASPSRQPTRAEELGFSGEKRRAAPGASHICHASTGRPAEYQDSRGSWCRSTGNFRCE